MVMFKESSKHSKLSTKLSTIWQINDYLSKKIDNRLIVDIIDTRGHPVYVVIFNLLSSISYPLDLVINITAREEWSASVGQLGKNATCRPAADQLIIQRIHHGRLITRIHYDQFIIQWIRHDICRPIDNTM